MTEPRLVLETGLAGRYEVVGEAGRGGMAVVYRARDLKHGRDVALKVLRPGLLGTQGAQRFLREVRVAAGLVHPHILPLHDSGELPGDPPTLYYVMPFVVGDTLRALLRKEGRLAVESALRITRQVAAALDYAHRRHVVHRDVKPENILFQDGNALVADFGVARTVREACEERDTAPGLAVGTPAYMSPEQAGGESSIDGRADEYALACMLYEMLAGEPPFTGPGRAVLLKHMTDSPPQLRTRRHDVPLAIEQVLHRALAKEPDGRFATVAEFAEALVTPLAGLSGSSRLAPRKGEPSRIVVLPFANRSGDAEDEYLGDGLTDELITTLAQVPGLWVASRTSAFALKGSYRDAREVGTLLGVHAILEGSVQRRGDLLRVTAQLSETGEGGLLWSGRYDRRPQDFLGILDEIAATIVGTLRGAVLKTPPGASRRYTESPEAYALYLKGRHSWNKRSAEGVREAIRYFEQAIALDPKYALALSGLADAHALGVDYRTTPVAEGMTNARTEAMRALALDDTLAEAHTSLGWVTFIHDWDWDRAGHHFRRAMELDPRYPTARQWHAWYLTAMGRVREAVAEARLAVDLDPASVSIRRSAGWILHYARDPGAGLADLRKAQVMNPESGETHMLLGLCLTSMGRYREAEDALREALALDPGDTPAMAARIRLRMLAGQADAARQMRDDLFALSREKYVSPTDLAKASLAVGDHDEAFRCLERAYDEHRGFLVYLRVDPILDPVRDDPRFADLLRRMRLD